MKRSSQDLDTEELDTEELDTEELDAEELEAERCRRCRACRRRMIDGRGCQCGAPRVPLLCQRAGVLLFGRVDNVKRLVRRRDRRPEREEIPLVLGLTLCFDRERIGFL